MKIKGFVKEENVAYKVDCVSYVSEENEDNFIEILTPSNNENTKVVQYFQRCELVDNQVFMDSSDTMLENCINKNVEKIYE